MMLTDTRAILTNTDQVTIRMALQDRYTYLLCTLQVSRSDELVQDVVDLSERLGVCLPDID